MDIGILKNFRNRIMLSCDSKIVCDYKSHNDFYKGLPHDKEPKFRECLYFCASISIDYSVINKLAAFIECLRAPINKENHGLQHDSWSFIYSELSFIHG